MISATLQPVASLLGSNARDTFGLLRRMSAPKAQDGH